MTAPVMTAWTYHNSIRDPRLRILSQNNRGLTATLNRMLTEAKGRWLVRQDADDVSYPNRLRRLAEFIGKYPEAGMFYSLADYYPSTSIGKFRSNQGSPEELRQIVNSGYLLSICHTSVVLNVEKTLALGGYRFNLHVEDRDLWWRMAIAHDIRFIPEVTVGFRQSLQSISSMNLAEQWLNGLYVQYLLLSRLWDLEPLPIEMVRVASPRAWSICVSYVPKNICGLSTWSGDMGREAGRCSKRLSLWRCRRPA